MKNIKKTLKLKDIIVNHIASNSKEYIIVTLLFIIGIFLGVLFVNNIKNDEFDSVQNYITTLIAKIAGIKITVCKSIFEKTKANPFAIPIVLINVEIVYPKQKPLYISIPNTIGIPITVVPKNHKLSASIRFFIILVFNSSPLSILGFSLNFCINQ